MREIVGTLRRNLKAPHDYREPEPPYYDPDELYGIIPDDIKKMFDMCEVIARLVDGSLFHEFKPDYGNTLVCGYASNGAGHYAMNSAAWDPRFIFTWPNTRVSVMGAEQAAKTLAQIKAAAMKREGKASTREEMAALEQQIFAEYEGTPGGRFELFDLGL